MLCGLFHSPDIEEGEKIARGIKSHMKAMESSLFSKFIQHSVHHDTCDASDFRETPEARGASRKYQVISSPLRKRKKKKKYPCLEFDCFALPFLLDSK